MLDKGQAWEEQAGFGCVRFEDGRPVMHPGDVTEATSCAS